MMNVKHALHSNKTLNLRSIMKNILVSLIFLTLTSCTNITIGIYDEKAVHLIEDKQKKVQDLDVQISALGL